jgi:hypothetical protein
MSCEGSVRVARKGLSRGAGREQHEVKAVEEVKETEEVRGRAVGWMGEEICGFSEDNMRESSTKLARK